MQVQTCLQLVELVADVLRQTLQRATAVLLSLAALRMVAAVTLQLVPLGVHAVLVELRDTTSNDHT